MHYLFLACLFACYWCIEKLFICVSSFYILLYFCKLFIICKNVLEIFLEYLFYNVVLSANKISLISFSDYILLISSSFPASVSSIIYKRSWKSEQLNNLILGFSILSSLSHSQFQWGCFKFFSWSIMFTAGFTVLLL